MSSVISGYNYDIFISYRQKDNKGDRWVSEFVDALKDELESTFKEEISVYFDINPHDGLLETHDVDESLKEKLKCLVFIPIISRTYCDPKSFAWEHEFKVFVDQASKDQFGLKVKLPNGNVANRVLPVQIHDLDNEDIEQCESVLGGVLRGIEFIYKSPGINRPLLPKEENPQDNLNHTNYRDQINKVALAIKEIFSSIYTYDKKDVVASGDSVIERPETRIQKDSQRAKLRKRSDKPWKRILLASAIVLFCAIVVVTLILTDVIKGGKGAKAGEIKSMVVLPFDNYTGDDQLENMISGMHGLLVGDMGRISGVGVMGTTTSNAYKDSGKSATEIASELNVDAILETSVMYLGDSVYMQFRLVRTTGKEEQLWKTDYRVDKSQINNLFNQITKQVADGIMIKLTPEEELLLAQSRTVDREAYDEYLKARSYWDAFSRESLNKALEYLNNAIEKDPDWAPLYSALAQVWMGIQQVGYEPTSVTFPEIYKNLDKALELDPNLSEAHASRALIAYLMEWDWEKSEKEFLKALAVNPNDAQSRVLYGQLLCTLQRTDEGIAQGRLALELDPLNPNIKVWYGAILVCAGDYKTALALGEEITASDPGNLMANSLIEAAAYQCKEYDKMIKAVRYLHRMINVKEEGINEIERIYRKQGIVKAYEKIMKYMEEYSENNNVSPISMAMTYIMANQPDKAMDWVEKGFEQRDPKMPTIASIFRFDPLFNNPRFIAICKKMNLPLPKTY